MTKFIVFLISILPFYFYAQSAHQEQQNSYNSIGKDNDWYEANTKAAPAPNRTKSSCNLNKVVYGWHPYWAGNTYLNYDWDLLSHFSYFSYEVNHTNGQPITTHGFATSAAVTAAINSGNTKVTLAVTMFPGTLTTDPNYGISEGALLTNFLANPTARQTLITNLINLIQSRGAHGVNIDFERIESSQKANFANFMVDLANQMHAAVPNSHVSTILNAVDWNNSFDFAIMNAAVDHYIIMGYDYYYGGSPTTGPTDPLFHFGSTYNYSLSKSISYYLDKGAPKNKLVMGLPYYGREWKTTSTTVPSNTVASSGTSVSYKVYKANAGGNYTAANRQFNNDSYTDIFVFNSGGISKQMYITDDVGFRKRLELINHTGIAGLGIWALGNDDGYNTFWSAIEDYLTNCFQAPCPGTIHDFGGPTKDYYNNENYTWTIAPPNAGSITVNFSSFDLENNFDFLYIYDGPTASSPQIPGSPFTGTTIPATFTTSLGAVTFKFTSDGATVKPGFKATYTCANGSSAPTTAINPSGAWQTSNFTTTFNDQDNVAVVDSFYLVSDFNGADWRANALKSYAYDKFDLNSLHADWSSHVGNWSVVANELKQTDQTSGNTNISLPVNQTNQNTFLYEWKGKIEGTGVNKRFGMHFFSDGASQTDRNNSYLVYWYPDQGKCRLHKSASNTLNFITETNVSFNPGNWYNFKVYYNPRTGVIKAYLDGVLTLSYTDTAPLQSGNAISLRTGDAVGYFDNIKVFKSRNSSALITLGTAADDIRYQNASPTSPSAKIESIVLDGNENWSTTATQLENIDWSIPASFTVNDGPGADISSFTTSNQIQANWTASTDTESGILEYLYAIGTSSGGTDVVNWTTNGTSTSLTKTGLSLVNGTTYYISVKAKNNALLETASISSNGQTLQGNSGNPVADFTFSTTVVCPGDPILFTNNSTNSTTYSWSFGQGSPASSSLENPSVVFPNSGTYTISLVAIGPGGTDILTQNINIVISGEPTAAFAPVTNPIYVPNTTAYFTNNSSNANSYSWDFGNGATSTDENPWTTYQSTGTYTVTLIVSNGICGNDTSTVELMVINNVGIGENEGNISEINLYPNPVDLELTVELNAKENTTALIETYTILGELVAVKSVQLTQGINSISPIDNLMEFAKGHYSIRIVTTETVYTKDFIKQ